MPETHSKIATALAESIALWVPDWTEAREVISKVVDDRLAEIRKVYEPQELARCPIVSHHGRPSPCAFCITAAVREFLLPEKSE